MARIQGDLVREDLLHYQLVDLVRNPEEMVDLGGSILQRRLKSDNVRKEKIQSQKNAFLDNSGKNIKVV